MGAIKPTKYKAYSNAHTENGITDNENTITDYWLLIHKNIYIYTHERYINKRYVFSE